MTYEVENRKTHKDYVIDEATFKALDMRKKFKLINSWDEKAKIKAPIPEEIIIKSKVGATKTHQEKETQNEIND
jgi:hypothetical protein